MAIDLQLDGKRALITGAGQGVGQSIAQMLADAGVHVLVNDYVPERATSVASAIEQAGGRAEPVPFDVTDFDAVRERIEAIGKVDILVNNAGNAGPEGWTASLLFVETRPPDWSRYVDVNLYGVMNCVHAVLPGMIESRWGRIVTIVSDAARSGVARMAAYCAAKAGAAGFGRGIAHEVARHGITVNNVSLGTIRTPVSEAFWADPEQAEQQKALLNGYLVRRPGEPGDVAWLVTSLVSPLASWVTGQTIPVNGGHSFAL
ncbi:MAG TPA: SDR family NAD(P)-dependent oxidoreductase [Acidimicrobiales bacterium]|nr:SDR family NAD(P)-dependent oxidoreductase [Acidimicrobiales bacterium]HXZ63012.1 SDR family NAD(P)-dependent oxidoreductase [Acidimicrobiales bacterium]